MKHVSLVLSILLLAFAAVANLATWRVPSVSAQSTSTANMLIQTSVQKKCVLVTTPLNFGWYDPVQAHATAPLDAQATMTVSCTKGAVVSIGIDDGANGSAQVRRMAGGAGSYLSYELYQDAGRTLRWGNVAGQFFDGGVAPSRDPRPFIVYGRVPGAQDVAEGAFQDTVVVTVNF